MKCVHFRWYICVPQQLHMGRDYIILPKRKLRIREFMTYPKHDSCVEVIWLLGSHTPSSRWVTPGTKMGALPVQACPESVQSPVMLRAQLVTILWMIQIIRRNSGWFFSHGKVPSKLCWCWPRLAFRVNGILTHRLSPGCWTVSHQFPSLFGWGNQGWE